MAETGPTGVVRRHSIGLALLTGSLPVLAVLMRFAGRRVTLTGDQAIFAMQVRDAGTGGFPTVGLYSRYGWNHPGPVAFYLLAPFQWIDSTWGVLLGAAAWNAAALGAAVWLALRRGGSALVALVVAAECATWLSIGGAPVLDPWTPNLAAALVIPLLVAAWGAALGDTASVVALLILGSIVTQVHVGYAVIVIVIALGALALAPDRRRLLARRPVLIGASVAIALWLPVIVGELTGHTHNIAALWRFFGGDEPPTGGWTQGARVIAGDIGRWPSWLGGGQPRSFLGEPTMRSALWVAALGVVLLAAATVACRRGDRRASVAAGIASAGLVAGVVAGTQVRGPFFHYLAHWRAPLITFAVVAMLVCAAPALSAGPRRAAAFVIAVAAVVGVIGSGAPADGVTEHGDEVGRLLDDVDAPAGERIVVRFGDSGFVGVGPGLLLWLENQGVDAGVDPSLGWVFGDRTTDPGTADEIWYALDSGWGVALLSALPGARIVAERTPFDAPTAARVVELQRSIAGQLVAVGAGDAVSALDSPLILLILADHPELDTAEVEELARLTALADDAGLRAGIVALSPADAPASLPWSLEGM